MAVIVRTSPEYVSCRPVYPYDNAIRVFLAGSIEQGAAENWQQTLIQQIKESEQRIQNTYNYRLPSVEILNPCRDDWDSSWVQSIHNEQFNLQVTWELDCLERADHIYLRLCENTKSVISMLELGMFAQSGKLFVDCDEKFWRKGNVDVVCNRYDVETGSATKFINEVLYVTPGLYS
jgi:hypothetical protein